MKKTLAVLTVAAMMFATGCGKDSKPVEEAKQDVNAAVEQVQEKAEEVAQNATNAVSNAANSLQAVIDDAQKTMTDIQNGVGDKTTIALDGVVPGINLKTVTDIYGEPIENDGTNLAFSNGLDMKVANDVIQEVSTVYDGLYTPADIAVGMVDYALNDAYGDANSVTMGDNGGVIYKYVSKDNRRTIEFVARDGYISEIKCTLNK